MIHKITSGEYMKRLDNMDGAERESYLNRVGEWLKRQAPLLTRKATEQPAEFQNAVQCSAGWNDAECQAFDDGARLLTALTGIADTWLPDMLYTKAAKRCIHKMVKTVSSFRFQASGDREPVAGNRMIAGAAKEAGYGKAAKEDPAEKTRKGTQDVAALPDAKPQVAGQNLKPEVVRPKHIDQYVHLLPKSTQKKAAMVQGLLRDMDVARENARMLAANGEHSDKIAQWAKTATKLDERIKAIYRELDAEWDKLAQSGRVTVDDFGNAHVAGSEELRMKNEEFATATEGAGASAKDAEAEPETCNLKPETKAQIKSLRSWLRDTRGPKDPGEKHDAYVVRWKEKYLELVKVAGKDGVTEAIVKAAGLYGIQLDAM